MSSSAYRNTACVTNYLTFCDPETTVTAALQVLHHHSHPPLSRFTSRVKYFEQTATTRLCHVLNGPVERNPTDSAETQGSRSCSPSQPEFCYFKPSLHDELRRPSIPGSASQGEYLPLHNLFLRVAGRSFFSGESESWVSFRATLQSSNYNTNFANWCQRPIHFSNLRCTFWNVYGSYVFINCKRSTTGY